jgi:histidine phosphotransferase ChpT
LFANDRTTLVWSAPRAFAPKTKIKLLLNLCLIAAAAAPRGGTITVGLAGQDDAMAIEVEAKGTNARLAHGVADILSGARGAETIDSHSIQPFYAMLLAKECGLRLDVATAQDLVKLRAAPPSDSAAESAAAAQAPAA